jgi:hypothetical protein
VLGKTKRGARRAGGQRGAVGRESVERRWSKRGSWVGGEGGVKEVTSVMRVVEFGFGFGSVSESEPSTVDAAGFFNGPETDGSSPLMNKAVMSAISRAMYISSAAVGRLEYHGRVNAIKFAMWCIRTTTPLLLARGTKMRVRRGRRGGGRS